MAGRVMAAWTQFTSLQVERRLVDQRILVVLSSRQLARLFSAWHQSIAVSTVWHPQLQSPDLQGGYKSHAKLALLGHKTVQGGY